MTAVSIRYVEEKDIDRCFEIECAAYSGDEAATREKILNRIKTYSDGFIVLENDKEIIGFINSGAADEIQLSDEDFKELIGHDPDGKNVAIMSVAVHPQYQKQGYASKLMRHFLAMVKLLQKKEVYLICQTDLVAMYAKFGFVDLGPSDSTHGGLSWHEMSMVL